MTIFDFIKYSIILCVLISFSSCDDKDNLIKPDNGTYSDIEIKTISVHNIGDFDYQDSLTYAAIDTSQYKIKVITEPEDANIYYSASNPNFYKQSNEWILIDSNINKIRFFANKQGFNNTDIKELDFAYNNDSLIYVVSIYPNPFNSFINIDLNSKTTRGELLYQVLNVSGQSLNNYHDFISDDSFQKSIDLSDLAPGMYLLKFEYGNTTLINKIIKE